MLIDSFAWIEYFMGTEMGVEVKQVVESDVQLYTSPIVIAEIYSKSLKIHAESKETMKDFGLADAFVLASARCKSVRVLTGDPHFKDFSESVML